MRYIQYCGNYSFCVKNNDFEGFSHVHFWPEDTADTIQNRYEKAWEIMK